MARRSKDLLIDSSNMSIQQQIEPGKVLIVVLDGHQGKAKICEAVEHGFTIIETAKGKTARIRFEESELF
ncbi:terminase [Bacillus thermocopriae]|jgi:Phage-like element PBSX protein XtrA|uniref:Terminase n=1 Tax=Neobacillus thermocopriae TaxID=1215031 RepID=A0A6B3TKG7_9BACI|nr:XtrA/YqaO family protein [Neobacillus thermocopriae]NEX77393.1 terminase [Neobacillus thermocopriae]